MKNKMSLKNLLTSLAVLAIVMLAISCEKEELGEHPNLSVSLNETSVDYSKTPTMHSFEFSVSATIYNGNSYDLEIYFGNGKNHSKSGLSSGQTYVASAVYPGGNFYTATIMVTDKEGLQTTTTKKFTVN